MDTRSELQATVGAMVQPGQGLLTAGESGPTIAGRFKTPPSAPGGPLA
jgi:fructose-bisphosphate aldolase class I